MRSVNTETIEEQLRAIDQGRIITVRLEDGREVEAKTGQQNAFTVWGNTILVNGADAFCHNHHGNEQNIGVVVDLEVVNNA